MTPTREELAKVLCENSPCHHKCHDTEYCVVEDEAQLLILENHLPSALTNEEKVSVKGNRMGVWIEENKLRRSSQFVCSACGKLAYYIQPTRDKTWQKHCPYKYCPNCGARMKDDESTDKMFFYPSDVRRMSPKEIKENYELIMESMKRW